MCKKVTLGVLAVALVGGLLFGGKLIPYSQTAYRNLRDAAQDRVPVSFQIDAAKDQLERIGPEIRDMVHQVAKEKVEIKRLAAELKQQDDMLSESYEEMMTLREHLESGDEYFVATNAQRYSNSRVEEDLRHRFTLYKTAEATRQKKAEILEIREKSLNAALAKLDEAKAQQRELEVQIENLTARHRMNEVVATATEINIDNSQLAKTRQMLNDIDAAISAQEEELQLAPKYYGQIPVSPESVVPNSNVLEEMDAYFNQDHDSTDEEVSTTEAF